MDSLKKYQKKKGEPDFDRTILFWAVVIIVLMIGLEG